MGRAFSALLDVEATHFIEQCVHSVVILDKPEEAAEGIRSCVAVWALTVVNTKATRALVRYLITVKSETDCIDLFSLLLPADLEIFSV